MPDHTNNQGDMDLQTNSPSGGFNRNSIGAESRAENENVVDSVRPSGIQGKHKPLSKIFRSSHHDAAKTNLTSIHEDVGSIPGLSQWVSDLELL